MFKQAVNGMTKIKITNGIPSPLPQCQIEVSVDKDAEILMITDMYPTIFALGIPVKSPDGNDFTVKVTVPNRYYDGNRLVVGIIDVNKEFAGSFTDGVNAQLIDASQL